MDYHISNLFAVYRLTDIVAALWVELSEMLASWLITLVLKLRIIASITQNLWPLNRLQRLSVTLPLTSEKAMRDRSASQWHAPTVSLFLLQELMIMVPNFSRLIPQALSCSGKPAPSAVVERQQWLSLKSSITQTWPLLRQRSSSFKLSRMWWRRRLPRRTLRYQWCAQILACLRLAVLSMLTISSRVSLEVIT